MDGFDTIDARCDIKSCPNKKDLVFFGNKEILCVKHADKSLNKLKENR